MLFLASALLALAESAAPTPAQPVSLVLSSASEAEIGNAIEECAGQKFYMFEPDPELNPPTALELEAGGSAQSAIERVRTGAKLASDAPARELLLAWLQVCAPYRGSEEFMQRGAVTTERLLRANRLAPENRDIAQAAGRYLAKYGWNLSEEGRLYRFGTIRPSDVGEFWRARYLASLGRKESALTAYGRALALRASDERRLWYAIALLQNEKGKEGLAQLAMLPASYERRRTSFWRARALLLLKQPSAARTILAELLAAPLARNDDRNLTYVYGEPGNVEGDISCLRGDAEADLRNFEAAETWYRASSCQSKLPRMLHGQGRWFDALLAFGEFSHPEDLPVRFECLRKLHADEAAWEMIEWVETWCARARAGREPKDACVWVKSARASLPPRAPLVEDPALLARLSTPRLLKISESPLPASVARKPLLRTIPTDVLEKASLTKGVAFSGREGKRLLVLTISRDLDPGGEAGSGGYWAHLSLDDGSTWKGPFYTGLAANFPYVIRPAAHQPPFDDNSVRLEVDVREIDGASLTFPPVSVRLRRNAEDVVITFPLAQLIADSDEDGLTDLYEEKLGLDPLARDTDGDGLMDAQDPLPLTPKADTESLEDELVLLAMKDVFTANEKARAPELAVQFVHSDRMRFASAAPPVRTVLLSTPALALHRERYGKAFYPLQIGAFVWNEDKSKGYFHYSFGWRGGGFLLTRTGATWKVESLGNWIT